MVTINCTGSYYYFYLFFLLLPLYPLLEYFVQVCTHWSICKACRDKWERGAAKARSSPPVLTIREDVFQREQQAIVMKSTSSVNGDHRSSRRVGTRAKVVTFSDDVAPPSRRRAGTDETGKFTNYDNLDEVVAIKWMLAICVHTPTWLRCISS